MNNDLFPNDPLDNENQTPENDSVRDETPTGEAPETNAAGSEEADSSPEAPNAKASDFADVNPAGEAPQKKSRGRLTGGVAVALVLLIALAALLSVGIYKVFYRLFHNASDDGVGSVQLSGFATLEGNELYHVGFVDTSLHRTNIRTGETDIVSENNVATITRYKGNLYYLSYALNDATQSYEYSYWKFVDGVNDQKLFATNTDISSPQFTDGYIYFMSPVNEVYSGYSNRLFRAPLAGGDIELVCDLLCISFLVDGNDLYLSLGEEFSYIKLNLSDTVAYVAANPLSEGVLRTQSEFSSEILFTKYLVSNAVRYGKSLYFIGIATDVGTQNGYELRAYDLDEGTPRSFNNGTYASLFRIYGDYIFYFSSTDSSIYRMCLDGSSVTRLTAPVYGYFNTSNDTFLYINWSDIGLPSIAVCDLDGNELMDVPLYDEETRQRAEALAANPTVPDDENYEDFGDLEGLEPALD